MNASIEAQYFRMPLDKGIDRDFKVKQLELKETSRPFFFAGTVTHIIDSKSPLHHWNLDEVSIHVLRIWQESSIEPHA